MFKVLFIFYFGCLIGSFLGVLAIRIPKKEAFILSRSKCDSCQQELSFLALIPFWQLIFHKNCCTYCKKKISNYYWIVECLCGVLFLIGFFNPWGLEYRICFYLSLLLFTLSLTDYFYGIVEPSLLYPVVLMLIVLQANSYTRLFPHFLDMLLIFCLFSLYNYLFPQQIGGGDIQLLTFLVFFTGLYSLLWIILLASLCGILYTLLKLLFIHNRTHKLPFVPFISLAFLIVTYFYPHFA